MNDSGKSWHRGIIRGAVAPALGLLAVGILYALVGGPHSLLAHAASTPAAATPDSQAESALYPWTVAQTVSAADFANELRDPQAAAKLVILCVAPHGVYAAAHIPGAVYHGTTSTPEGKDDLYKWAKSLPRTTNLLVYCGCCPMNECPNLPPAFVELKEMGFTHLRILVLPKDFYTDWAQKGYPTETSK